MLGAGNSSNMAEGEIAMMPNLTESDNIMTTAPITQGVEQHTSDPDESISQKNNANTDDIQTSSSESDVDKKVNLINPVYVNIYIMITFSSLRVLFISDFYSENSKG